MLPAMKAAYPVFFRFRSVERERKTRAIAKTQRTAETHRKKRKGGLRISSLDFFGFGGFYFSSILIFFFIF